MENINEALMLMVIGMATVFAVLLLVIYFSKTLITLINKYFPESISESVRKNQAEVIPSKIVAAISAAVAIATDSKAKIVKIEKIKK